MITFDDIKNNETINTYIIKADESLKAIGYTEHGFAHVTKVANDASLILETLGYDERTVTLAKIAGYMHDIGNLVNRIDHSQSGALMTFRLLDEMGMDADEIATVVTAIGNHDEGSGLPVNSVAAALILADKSDVRYSRVRNTLVKFFDIHDRVNYSVKKSLLEINETKDVLTLTLEIDVTVSSVMEYFEIFLERMLLCKKAAEALELKFKLIVNNQQLL